MAQPTEFFGSNVTFRPGRGTEDTVSNLTVYRSPGGECISRWELSEAEIEEVKRSGAIWLSQMTYGHPLQPAFVSGLPLMTLVDADGSPLAGYDAMAEHPSPPVVQLLFDAPPEVLSLALKIAREEIEKLNREKANESQ